MPETVIVNLGDSIPSLALEYGFFWKTLWNYGPNAALKTKRQNPNVLLPGDEVAMPDKTLKTVTKGVDNQHKFKRKGEPSIIRMQLIQDEEPRANEPYVLNIDKGRIKRQGSTDANGVLEEGIPGDAHCAELVLKNGKEIYQLAIGNLNPIDEISGVQQRLNNLCMQAGAEDGEMNDQLRDAIKRFQSENLLPVTGEIDTALKAKLQELTQ